jgi:hypothetical protein
MQRLKTKSLVKPPVLFLEKTFPIFPITFHTASQREDRETRSVLSAEEMLSVIEEKNRENLSYTHRKNKNKVCSLLFSRTIQTAFIFWTA